MVTVIVVRRHTRHAPRCPERAWGGTCDTSISINVPLIAMSFSIGWFILLPSFSLTPGNEATTQCFSSKRGGINNEWEVQLLMRPFFHCATAINITQTAIITNLSSSRPRISLFRPINTRFYFERSGYEFFQGSALSVFAPGPGHLPEIPPQPQTRNLTTHARARGACGFDIGRFD
ncbi:hypothetical protein HGRIS_004151 [Hohenbuehelia grisea]|uniref:Uncharacterized protein n=1 Tax=Hohenbuehelia grisea TaxID=104357 RepID=A0ABR3JHN2_9AGAR